MSNRDLVNRLRGIYNIPVNDGAGLLDGKSTFTRTFDNLPPIQQEAALAIERLQIQLGEARIALESALRYIEHVGANHTEKGEPHPQQWLVDLIKEVLAHE